MLRSFSALKILTKPTEPGPVEVSGYKIAAFYGVSSTNEDRSQFLLANRASTQLT